MATAGISLSDFKNEKEKFKEFYNLHRKYTKLKLKKKWDDEDKKWVSWVETQNGKNRTSATYKIIFKNRCPEAIGFDEKKIGVDLNELSRIFTDGQFTDIKMIDTIIRCNKNNDTSLAVINTIDITKLDKVKLVQLKNILTKSRALIALGDNTHFVLALIEMDDEIIRIFDTSQGCKFKYKKLQQLLVDKVNPGFKDFQIKIEDVPDQKGGNICGTNVSLLAKAILSNPDDYSTNTILNTYIKGDKLENILSDHTLSRAHTYFELRRILDIDIRLSRLKKRIAQYKEENPTPAPLPDPAPLPLSSSSSSSSSASSTSSTSSTSSEFEEDEKLEESEESEEEYITETISIGTVSGKEYPLRNLNNYEQYLTKLSQLYSEGKLKDEYGHQDACANILKEETPYRGLLIFHELGSGKTPTSIKIVQNNPSKIAWILTKAALSGKKSFLTTLKSINNYSKFNENFKKIGGYVSEILKFDKRLDGKTNKEKIQFIDEHYKFAHYNGDAMISELTKNQLKNESYQNKIENILRGDVKNPFDNSVIIIDEVQNVAEGIINASLSETGFNKESNFTVLYALLTRAINCKIGLLTATPIINRIYTIGILLNMVAGKKLVHKIKLKYKNILPSTYLNQKLNEQFVVKDQHENGTHGILYTATKGFIFKNNDIKIALRILPSQLNISNKIMNQLKKDKGITSITKLYLDAPFPEPFIVRNGKIINKTSAIDDFIEYNPTIDKNKNLFYSKAYGLISYYKMDNLKHLPTKRYYKKYNADNPYDSEDSEDSDSDNDDDDWSDKLAPFYINLTNKQKLEYNYAKDDKSSKIEYAKYPKLSQICMTSSELLGIPSNDDLWNKKELYSSKYNFLMDKLQSDKKTIIYADLKVEKRGGIYNIQKLLESSDYTEWEPGQTDGDPKNKYAIYSGDVDQELRNVIISGFRKYDRLQNKLKYLSGKDKKKGEIDCGSKTNNEGFRILLITSAGSEGINTCVVEQVHIMQPFWHNVRLEQTIGRARRANSHKHWLEHPNIKKILPNGVNIDIYIHLGNIEEYNTLDVKKWKIAEKKRKNADAIISAGIKPLSVEENVKNKKVIKINIDSNDLLKMLITLTLNKTNYISSTKYKLLEKMASKIYNCWQIQKFKGGYKRKFNTVKELSNLHNLITKFHRFDAAPWIVPIVKAYIKRKVGVKDNSKQYYNLKTNLENEKKYKITDDDIFDNEYINDCCNPDIGESSEYSKYFTKLHNHNKMGSPLQLIFNDKKTNLIHFKHFVNVIVEPSKNKIYKHSVIKVNKKKFVQVKDNKPILWSIHGQIKSGPYFNKKNNNNLDNKDKLIKNSCQRYGTATSIISRNDGGILYDPFNLVKECLKKALLANSIKSDIDTFIEELQYNYKTKYLLYKKLTGYEGPKLSIKKLINALQDINIYNKACSDHSILRFNNKENIYWYQTGSQISNNNLSYNHDWISSTRTKYKSITTNIIKDYHKLIINKLVQYQNIKNSIEYSLKPFRVTLQNLHKTNKLNIYQNNINNSFINYKLLFSHKYKKSPSVKIIKLKSTHYQYNLGYALIPKKKIHIEQKRFPIKYEDPILYSELLDSGQKKYMIAKYYTYQSRLDYLEKIKIKNHKKKKWAIKLIMTNYDIDNFNNITKYTKLLKDNDNYVLTYLCKGKPDKNILQSDVDVEYLNTIIDSLQKNHPFNSNLILDIENMKARKTLFNKIRNKHKKNKLNVKPNYYKYIKLPYKSGQEYTQPKIDSDNPLMCDILSKIQTINNYDKLYPEFIIPDKEPSLNFVTKEFMNEKYYKEYDNILSNVWQKEKTTKNMEKIDEIYGGDDLEDGSDEEGYVNEE